MKPFSYKSREWQALRLATCKRFGWRCALCGDLCKGLHAARVDHVITVAENPARAMDPTNLRVLCVRCDAKRHADKGTRLAPRIPIGLDGFPK